ncbi:MULTISPECIES: hypothetical protein [Halomonadaceae]|uniref:Uncharacterized protein n=1 Tax=Halomonas campaniensis TaxID=213554 RepID=A0A3D0KH61_9GAMM|nr:hypothetical protein [Halomonas sp. 3F2F]HCA02804.1 hypothetical protein [Halomonas campaniensis]
MGVFNANIAETAPGCCLENPFCPPEGWSGNDGDYKELLQVRWKDVKYGQRMRFSLRFAKHSRLLIRGPYARIAGEAVTKLLARNDIKALLTLEET